MMGEGGGIGKARAGGRDREEKPRRRVNWGKGPNQLRGGDEI